MLILIITVLLGLGFAYFAFQNTTPVDVNVASYTFRNLPLYLVTLIPLLIGLVVSFFLHLIKDLSQSLTINEQKDKTKHLKRRNAEITKKLHKLELENAKLKAKDEKGFDEESI